MSDEGFSALRVQLQRLRKLSDEITRVLLSGEEIIRNYDSLRGEVDICNSKRDSLANDEQIFGDEHVFDSLAQANETFLDPARMRMHNMDNKIPPAYFCPDLESLACTAADITSTLHSSQDQFSALWTEMDEVRDMCSNFQNHVTALEKDVRNRINEAKGYSLRGASSSSRAGAKDQKNLNNYFNVLGDHVDSEDDDIRQANFAQSSSKGGSGSGSKRLQKNKSTEIIDIAGEENEDEFLASSSKEQQPKPKQQPHSEEHQYWPEEISSLHEKGMAPFAIRDIKLLEEGTESENVDRLDKDEHENDNAAATEAFNLRDQDAQHEQYDDEVDTFPETEINITTVRKKAASTAEKENRQRSPDDYILDDGTAKLPSFAQQAAAFPEKVASHTHFRDKDENEQHGYPSGHVNDDNDPIFQQFRNHLHEDQYNTTWQGETNKKLASPSSSSSKANNKRSREKDDTEDAEFDADQDNSGKKALRMRSKGTTPSKTSSGSKKTAPMIDLT